MTKTKVIYKAQRSTEDNRTLCIYAQNVTRCVIVPADNSNFLKSFGDNFFLTENVKRIIFCKFPVFAIIYIYKYVLN